MQLQYLNIPIGVFSEDGDYSKKSFEEENSSISAIEIYKKIFLFACINCLSCAICEIIKKKMVGDKNYSCIIC